MATYLTQDDVNNFGHEILDVAQRAAQHALAPELQRLHDENRLLQDQLDVTKKTTIDRELDAAVPNWRQVNEDERFHQWLLMPEPYSGVIRDRLLKHAAHAGNAQRVIRFFKGYLAQAGAADQASTSPASQRAPRRAPSGKPIYTRDQINQMWSRRRKGEINDSDWARWEYELIAAGREGRIAGSLGIDGVPLSR